MYIVMLRVGHREGKAIVCAGADGDLTKLNTKYYIVQVSLPYLHNAHLACDFRQSTVKVVWGQSLPPHGFMFISSNPTNSFDKTKLWLTLKQLIMCRILQHVPLIWKMYVYSCIIYTIGLSAQFGCFVSIQFFWPPLYIFSFKGPTADSCVYQFSP